MTLSARWLLGQTAVTTNRRNPTRRAQAFRQLAAMLIARRNASVSEERVAVVANVSPIAAGRMLRRLAFKMLARSVGKGQWTATAVLCSGAELSLRRCWGDF